ncbi:NCS1 nucleoside transporter family [Saitoella complicata NRRL Y-17804]|nr:NCS1 nucleoside transporter family [Saitoella complicata NRRL Y-17804]ODQ50462.1 NCS1 nucleoside transporter family [Saitoella complicata NRRL Y-17804]GAO46631.1 hypothetical protein G7K_0857-t1 [Saitoella complicata NRRL Y-17804]
MSWLINKIQLPDHHGVAASLWSNADLIPLPPSRRTWGPWAFVGFWAINNLCISTWQTGSSLLGLGLSVWQAMIAVIIARIIISLVAVFNGWVGAKWHIGFSVMSRYVWGIWGSYIALIQRIVLSIVWCGVQSYTGGLCITAMLSAIFPTYHNMKNTLPASAHMTTQQFVGFILYNLASLPIIYLPPEKTKVPFQYINGITAATMFSIMVWALATAHGAGPLLSQSSTLHSSTELGWGVVHGITTVIGSIAVGLTNQPDYSRFARKPGDQVWGQFGSIIIIGTIVPLMGCVTTAAAQKIFGELLWNPPDLVLRWLDDYSAKSRAAAFFAGLGLCMSQLGINTVDNAYSGGMDFAGLFPKYLNIRRGAYLTLAISILFQPWQLLSSASVFLTVLGGYSVFLGPLVGIQICDYWIIRRQQLKLSDLYLPSSDSIYWYKAGVNWRTIVAWVIGFAPALPGFISSVNPGIVVGPPAMRLNYLAFPLGFAISFLVFFGINRIFPPPGLGEVDDSDVFGTFTGEEAANMGIESYHAGRGDLVLEGEAKDTYNEVDVVASDLEKKIPRVSAAAHSM